jgi:hypothetical protein
MGIVLPVTAALRLRKSRGSKPSSWQEHVHGLFHGKGRLDASRSAIGLGPRLVGDDVETLQMEIGALVERSGGLHEQGRAQPGQAAGIHAIGALDGKEPPVPLGGNRDIDHGAGRRAAAALQNLLAREHELDRAAALLGQADGDGLAMDGDLAAEAATDLERHNFQL